MIFDWALQQNIESEFVQIHHGRCEVPLIPASLSSYHWHHWFRVFFPSTPAKIKPARWITESLNRVISKGVFFLQTLTLCLHRNVFVPKRSNVNWWYRTLLSWLWLGWWMSRSYQPGKPVSFSWLTSVWLNENLTHFLFFLSSSIWLELG